MSIAYARTLAEEAPSDESSGSSDVVEDEELLHFTEEELLAERNEDTEQRTDAETIEGRTHATASASIEVGTREVLLFPPPSKPMREHFQALQKWEGYVLEVQEDTFFARLVPIRGEGGDQEAEIYLNEVTEEDRPLVEPGAIFYWSIGYLHKPSGTIRASVIRFRRLPAWTKRELETARKKAEELRELLDVE